MNLRSSSLSAGLPLLLASLGFAAGCDEATGPVSYSPFDAANHAAPYLEVVRASELVVAAKASTSATADVDFPAVLANYQANLPGQAYSLEDSITALADGHAYGSATIGVYLDAQIEAAIALGAASTSANPDAARDLAYAQQAVDKLPLVYFYLATHGELSRRNREGLDAAYGIYSFIPDTMGVYRGLYASAVKRETAWTITINAPLEGFLVDARGIVAANTTGNLDPVGANAALDQIIDRADREMLRIFAYGARSYLEKLASTPAASPDVALIEGRIFWLALRGWAEANQASAASAVTTALYPTGEAAVGAPGLHTAYGLAAYYNGTYDGIAAPGVAAIQTIIAALETN